VVLIRLQVVSGATSLVGGGDGGRTLRPLSHTGGCPTYKSAVQGTRKIRPLRGHQVRRGARRPSELELDEVTGGEALGFDADCTDAVGAVAADLSSVVHDEDQQVPLLRAAEGVGLDLTWSDSALHGVIVDGDLETVRSGESYELDGRAVLPGGHVPGWPPVSDLLSRLDLGQLWQRSASVQPGEHIVELGPEVVEAGQVRQLVAEHVRPLGLDLVSERGRADRGKGRRVDACVGTLRR